MNEAFHDRHGLHLLHQAPFHNLFDTRHGSTATVKVKKKSKVVYELLLRKSQYAAARFQAGRRSIICTTLV
jgi:hypothetical protein